MGLLNPKKGFGGVSASAGLAVSTDSVVFFMSIEFPVFFFGMFLDLIFVFKSFTTFFTFFSKDCFVPRMCMKSQLRFVQTLLLMEDLHIIGWKNLQEDPLLHPPRGKVPFDNNFWHGYWWKNSHPLPLIPNRQTFLR